MLWLGFVCVFQVAETLPRGGRSQIAIPAQGMIDFRDALTKLLDHFGCEDHDGNNHNRVYFVQFNTIYFRYHKLFPVVVLVLKSLSPHRG